MTRTTSKLMGAVTAVAGALALMTFSASAQTTTTAPPPPKTAPAAKAPATTTAPKAAATTAKTPVVCKGKDEASCKAESTCNWIVPKKVEANGKVDAAYCRRVAGVAKKAADKKAATPPATTAPAATAPAAPAKK